MAVPESNATAASLPDGIAGDLREAIDAATHALDAITPGWTLRPCKDADTPFLDELYAASRWEELAPIPWPDEAKRAFLYEQSRLQADHYGRHYPGAALCVLECAGAPSGRLYLYASAGEFRLMDIVVSAPLRGRGYATAIIRALQDVARTQSRSITLHVEPNNPVLRLYERLGFRLIEDRGVYRFLGWSAGDQLNTAS